MLKIKIDELSSEQRSCLAHAFDHGISQFIEFGVNEFIGVHLGVHKNLLIQERAGVWSYGQIKR